MPACRPRGVDADLLEAAGAHRAVDRRLGTLRWVCRIGAGSRLVEQLRLRPGGRASSPSPASRARSCSGDWADRVPTQLAAVVLAAGASAHRASTRSESAAITVVRCTSLNVGNPPVGLELCTVRAASWYPHRGDPWARREDSSLCNGRRRQGARGHCSGSAATGGARPRHLGHRMHRCTGACATRSASRARRPRRALRLNRTSWAGLRVDPSAARSAALSSSASAATACSREPRRALRADCRVAPKFSVD